MMSISPLGGVYRGQNIYIYTYIYIYITSNIYIYIYIYIYVVLALLKDLFIKCLKTAYFARSDRLVVIANQQTSQFGSKLAYSYFSSQILKKRDYHSTSLSG